ncbi:MAG TPA: ABC transporter permease [Longimicrobium sp.]|nr:ABC transporter permease [Longimicrobium sp.]
MNFWEGVRLALNTIRTNKLRAFFTVLGTVVGVTFLIAVITLIEGMNAYVEKEFKGAIYGVNTVVVRRFPAVNMEADGEQWREFVRRPRLTIDDAEWLSERMETPGLVSLSAETDGAVQGPRGQQLENVQITGANAEYFEARELEMQAGRTFSRQESDKGVPVVVIGSGIAEALWDNRNPVGQELRIRGLPFRVVGVLKERGSLMGFSMDNVVVAPLRAGGMNGWVNRQRNAVGSLTYKVPEAELIRPAMDELETLMRVRRGLKPSEGNNFSVETAEDSLAFWDKIRTILLLALPMLVGISLIVGAIVIMNIMLVSVAERTREIGVRKSLGARRKDILMQFLIESSALSAAGAFLGIGAGVLLAKGVQAATPMPATVAPWSIALAIFLGVGVGLAAGVYPAWRASRLDPIVALRSE